MRTDIDRRVAELALDPGPGMTPGALELFEEITATPAVAIDQTTEPARTVPRRCLARRRTPRRAPLSTLRWRIAVPLTAGLAAAALAVSWVLPNTLVLGPRSTAAAFDITREDGYYIIKVKRLFADPNHYEAQLHDLGLDISVRLQPVSPSLEGSVFTAADPDITTTQRAGVCGDWLRCPIELKVPVGYQEKASVLLGRKARPGEVHQAMSRIEMPGEPLHCVDYVNKTVDRVRTLLRERGVTIGKFAYQGHGTRPSVPGSWYVHEGVLSEPGKAHLLVSPARHRYPVPLSAFCPKAS